MKNIHKSNKTGVITIYVDDFNYDDWKSICEELDLCPHETQSVELHLRYSISSGDGFNHEITKYDRDNQKSLLDYHLEMI